MSEELLPQGVKHTIAFLRLAADELRKIAEQDSHLTDELRHIAEKLEGQAHELRQAGGREGVGFV